VRLRVVRDGLVLTFLVSAVIGGPVSAQVSEPPTSVVVEGIAEIELDPTFAEIVLEIESVASSRELAVSDAEDRLEAVADTLADLGVLEDSLDSGEIEVAQAGGAAYEASAELVVHVEDPDVVAELLRIALGSGASVSEVTFGTSDSSALRARVLDRAMADARGSAEEVASSRGLRLGLPTLVTVSRDAGPVQVRALASAPRSAVLAVRPEKIVVRATVTVRWQLLP